MADVETNVERPIPDLPPVTAPPVDNNPVDEDSDSDGRRHASTSVSKTRVSVHTPAEDRAAMQQLKQRIDFSDHSVPSSNQSTPKKSSNEPAVGSTDAADTEAAVPYISEGEITESVSVSTILSRLDTVRNYLKEAEQLHKQLQLKMGEAGSITQLSKISKLIEQLRHQESGYLGILMKVIGSSEDDEKQATSSDGSDCGGSDGTESDDDDDDVGEDNEGMDDAEATNPTELQEGGNLSLRSELTEVFVGEGDGDSLDQERELRVLREQHALLKKLLEHQRQLKDLELKQSALMEMKRVAEEKLAADYEKQQTQQPEGADGTGTEGSSAKGKVAEEMDAEENGTEEKDAGENGTEEKDAEENGTEEKDADENGTEEKDADENGTEEKDADESLEPKNEEIEYQMLLNKLSELKARKSRVDQLLSLLSELNISTDDLEGVQERTEENITGDMQLSNDQQVSASADHAKDMNLAASQGHEVQPADMGRSVDSKLETADAEMEECLAFSKTYEKAAEGSLEESRLAEYESRLAEKQTELAKLITQRNELMATQKKLLKLQELSLQDQTEYPKLSHELSYKPIDVTGATWGGSTVQTDDTTSSVSVPVDLDETQDSMEDSSPLKEMLSAVAGSAAVEEKNGNKGVVEFRVDRHKLDQETPRKIITPVKQLGSTGKKRKLDEGNHSVNSDTFKLKGACTSNDTWLPRGFSKDEMTQTVWPSGSADGYHEQGFAGLQERLGFTSHVCTELLKGQNNLIYALCQYSENARQQASAYDQFIQLQQYHGQLQNYHQKLLDSYHELSSEDAVTARAEFVNQDSLSNKQTCKSEGGSTNGPLNPSQPIFGKPEVHVPPPLPPLLFQTHVRPSSANQDFSSSFQSSFPNKKWFYEQPATSVPQVQPSGTGTACTSSSYNFTASLPFDLPKSQLGPLLNTSYGAAGSAAQAQVSSSCSIPHGNTRSDVLPTAAASNFSPDSTGSTLRVSPDSMVNNKGSLDLSHSKVDVDKVAPLKMVSNGPVIDKEKKTESFSSLPSNLPESLRHGHMDLPETPVFDSLRETIYSEVAQLIANNESRPHFLVELFRKLQLLNTDYLRQRALYSIEDLIVRFLTEEGVAHEEFKITAKTLTADSASECTPSETALTDDEVVVRKDLLSPEQQNANAKYDYFEPVDSASSLSTPSEHPYDQFASLNLGNTVIRLDRAVAGMRSMCSAEGSPVKTMMKDDPLDSLQTPEVDTHVLDEKIRSVMIEVIPLLKENMANDCTLELLGRIRQYVRNLVLTKEKEQKPEYMDKFAKQLDASLNATLTKFVGKKLKDCGEEILVDISEVLFNELAFFRLMQEVRGYFHHSEFRSVTSASHTTTDNEEDISNQCDVQSPQVHVDLKTGGKECIEGGDENRDVSGKRETPAAVKGETDTSCCCVNDTAPAQDSKLIQQNLVCSVASDSDTALQTQHVDHFKIVEEQLQGCSAVIASIEEQQELAGQGDEMIPLQNLGDSN